jgi:carbamoyl-phosphate synthase large subunit
LDKLLFYQAGSRLGFPVIQTSLSIDDISTQQFVVKERMGAGSDNIGINIDRVAAIRLAKGQSQPVFQPFVAGKEYSIDVFISRAGDVKGAVCRSRDKVVSGESQVTTTHYMPELEKASMEFAKALGLSGHVVFQAIIDNSKKIHFIECNSRFGGASTLSLAAGLDSFYWSILEAKDVDISQYCKREAGKQLQQVRYVADHIRYLQ